MKRFLIALILFTSQTQAQTPIYLDSDQPLEARVEDALSRLTLEEKVALCHAQSKFSSKGVQRLGIPELWMSDGPHGIREEIDWDSWNAAKWTNDYCMAFPALTCLAATWNPKLSYEYGVAIGQEARYRKKDVLLGPGVNIYRTPLNGRNFEYMGEDPLLASKLVVPYVKGVQSNGVAACVKHYALNNQEVYRGHINVIVSDRALREIYLPAFRAAVVDGGAWSIMGAYNKYKGQHCCHNEILLNKILKQEWGFDGCVITDWGGAHDTHQAALFGLDIEMGTGTNGLTLSKDNAYDNYYLALPYLEELKKGSIPLSTLDDKARRVLRLIFRTAMNLNKPWGSFATTEHATVARKVAQEGIVLLKNNNILPIDTDQVRSIAVIGQNATRSMTYGGGSSMLKPSYEISPLDGIKSRFGNKVKISYAQGYDAGPCVYGEVIPSKMDAELLKSQALNIAAQADMVIFVGGLNKNHQQDCEDGDRKEYNLPFGQDKLIEELLKVNKNLVLVLVSGNAVQIPQCDKLPAIVQAWYLGSESGNALASVLCGDVNPSGKLPISFAENINDWGAHSFGQISYPGDNVNQEYKEDIFVGYRWMDTKKINPRFPFGHGLSYTTFEYGKPSVNKKTFTERDSVEVVFRLKNTGTRHGAEVAQLYVGDPKCSVARPVKELKGFQKVFLDAGQSTNIKICVAVKDFAFYDETSNKWSTEPGEYILYLGASSRDIKHKISVWVSK